jgi:alkylation response protein AidB-like acyl-CoA dehydrogenase
VLDLPQRDSGASIIILDDASSHQNDVAPQERSSDLGMRRVFWGILGFAAVNAGLAHRVFQWTLQNIKHKISLALGRSMAYYAEVQHAIAELVIELASVGPRLEKSTQEPKEVWTDMRPLRLRRKMEETARSD